VEGRQRIALGGRIRWGGRMIAKKGGRKGYVPKRKRD
jgi:hypothetical protein